MRFGKFLPFLIAIFLGIRVSGQDCIIRNKMRPDGSIFYFMDQVLFFNTPENKLFGGVLTDKETYMLTLTPHPFPPKSKENKLKQDLLVTLSNQKEYKLEYYDAQYLQDTALLMLYIIGKNALADFREHDVESVKLNMGQDKGTQTFQLRLHKSALKVQLVCLSDKKN